MEENFMSKTHESLYRIEMWVVCVFVLMSMECFQYHDVMMMMMMVFMMCPRHVIHHLTSAFSIRQSSHQQKSYE